MKIHPAIARRLFRNALLSLLLYALPIILMFLSFYISGERPWEKQKQASETSTVKPK